MNVYFNTSQLLSAQKAYARFYELYDLSRSYAGIPEGTCWSLDQFCAFLTDVPHVYSLDTDGDQIPLMEEYERLCGTEVFQQELALELIRRGLTENTSSLLSFEIRLASYKVARLVAIHQGWGSMDFDFYLSLRGRQFSCSDVLQSIYVNFLQKDYLEELGKLHRGHGSMKAAKLAVKLYKDALSDVEL